MTYLVSLLPLGRKDTIMSTKFYLKDKNGTIPASNGQGMFRVIQGKELNDFLKEECNRKRCFYTFRNDTENIGIECSEEEYKEIKAIKNRENYIRKRQNETAFKEISSNQIVDDSEEDIEMIDTIEDENSNVEEICEKKERYEKLYKAIEMLSDEEKDMIIKFFFLEKPMTERQYAEEKGLHYMTIHNRKVALLKKIKKFL